jgi:hypothetical protein
MRRSVAAGLTAVAILLSSVSRSCYRREQWRPADDRSLGKVAADRRFAPASRASRCPHT